MSMSEMSVSEIMDKFDIFSSPKMEITIADVHTDDDCKKLSNKIHKMLKDKCIQRLLKASLCTIATGGLLAGATKLFFKLSDRSRNNSTELFAIAMTPFAFIVCRSIYNVAQGIIMCVKGKYKLSYAQNVTEKIKDYFDELSRSDFAVTVKFDDFNPERGLEFTNGMAGCRYSPVLSNKNKYVVSKVVGAIKEFGLASHGDYIRNDRKISCKDPNWEVVKSEYRDIMKKELLQKQLVAKQTEKAEI
ncbi:MAG: hypothetical protein H0W88_05150 [Parachlamydiaceae bacterium]|nr:hypothetical protein [Parachlamydiaceae bacterium]